MASISSSSQLPLHEQDTDSCSTEPSYHEHDKNLSSTPPCLQDHDKDSSSTKPSLQDHGKDSSSTKPTLQKRDEDSSASSECCTATVEQSGQQVCRGSSGGALSMDGPEILSADDASGVWSSSGSSSDSHTELGEGVVPALPHRSFTSLVGRLRAAGALEGDAESPIAPSAQNSYAAREETETLPGLPQSSMTHESQRSLPGALLHNASDWGEHPREFSEQVEGLVVFRESDERWDGFPESDELTMQHDMAHSIQRWRKNGGDSIANLTMGVNRQHDGREGDSDATRDLRKRMFVQSFESCGLFDQTVNEEDAECQRWRCQSTMSRLRHRLISWLPKTNHDLSRPGASMRHFSIGMLLIHIRTVYDMMQGMRVFSIWKVPRRTTSSTSALDFIRNFWGSTAPRGQKQPTPSEAGTKELVATGCTVALSSCLTQLEIHHHHEMKLLQLADLVEVRVGLEQVWDQEMQHGAHCVVLKAPACHELILRLPHVHQVKPFVAVVLSLAALGWDGADICPEVLEDANSGFGSLDRTHQGCNDSLPVDILKAYTAATRAHPKSAVRDHFVGDSNRSEVASGNSALSSISSKPHPESFVLKAEWV